MTQIIPSELTKYSEEILREIMICLFSALQYTPYRVGFAL